MQQLILRLDAPLQSWGGVAMDPQRPTLSFPTRSALSGLLASALGWRYRDGHRTTALQDALRYAVREDRPPVPLRDYQTADLDRIGRESWTRWGVERRGGGTAASGTHILEKHYLAGAVFTVALWVGPDSPAPIDALAEALRRPARPLFLGRRACIPARPIFQGVLDAAAPLQALERWPVSPGATPPLRCWYFEGEGPSEGEPIIMSDRRDFVTDRFSGERLMREVLLEPVSPEEEGGAE